MIDMLARPLFRVGDTVTVASELDEDGSYYMFNGWGDLYWFVPNMYRYRRQRLRINKIDSDCYRAANASEWGWVDEMFVESNRVTKFLRN